MKESHIGRETEFFLADIVAVMGSSNKSKIDEAILKKLVKNKEKGADRKRIISNAKTFLEFILKFLK